MNIFICKYGQKVIFNRNSNESKRSNTNGNVGLYKILKLMFERNNDTFYFLSKNDTLEHFNNVIDCSEKYLKDIDNILVDCLIVIAGIKEYENDERLIEILNYKKCNKFIIISEDPRCLKSMSMDERLKNVPDVIISQFEGEVIFKDKVVKVRYAPIQAALCYKEKDEKEICFNDRLLAIANDSGVDYNRIEILKKLIEGIQCDVYGRIFDDDIKCLNGVLYHGEVTFEEMQNVIRKSFYSLLIPIEKGWCTAKYLECLMFNVLPIFYVDYNVEIIGLDRLKKYVVSNNEELNRIIGWIKMNKKEVISDIRYFKEKLVIPYFDGKILNEKIYEIIGG